MAQGAQTKWAAEAEITATKTEGGVRVAEAEKSRQSIYRLYPEQEQSDKDIAAQSNIQGDSMGGLQDIVQLQRERRFENITNSVRDASFVNQTVIAQNLASFHELIDPSIRNKWFNLLQQTPSPKKFYPGQSQSAAKLGTTHLRSAVSGRNANMRLKSLDARQIRENARKELKFPDCTLRRSPVKKRGVGADIDMPDQTFVTYCNPGDSAIRPNTLTPQRQTTSLTLQENLMSQQIDQCKQETVLKLPESQQSLTASLSQRRKSSHFRAV